MNRSNSIYFAICPEREINSWKLGYTQKNVVADEARFC